MIYLNKKRKLYPVKLDNPVNPFTLTINGLSNQNEIDFNNLDYEIKVTEISDNIYTYKFGQQLYIDANNYELISIPEIEGYYTPDITGIYSSEQNNINVEYNSCKLTINQTGLSGTDYAIVRYTMWKSGKQIEKQVQYGNSIYVPYNTQITIEPHDNALLNSDVIVFNNINLLNYTVNCYYQSVLTSVLYEYNGSSQTTTLQPGIYTLQCWGAEGGGRRLSGNSSSGFGGLGGYSIGNLTLENETKIFIYVGGHGSYSVSGPASGGFNGGGSGHASGTIEPGNGGGGASDIRLKTDSLYARVIVAGGGGGGGEDFNDTSGHGGGLTGVGCEISSYDASQTSPGLNASFGNGAGTLYGDGGGGGGGWYGGGTQTGNSSYDTEGGGGGSGYVYTSSTASDYPSGCLLNASYYLTDAETIAGNRSFPSPSGGTETGHQGHGAVKITSIIKSEQKHLYQTEYIENINNDYILTDIIPKGNQTVYYKIKINETNTTKPYFGGRTAIGNSVIALWQISGKIRKDFGSTGTTESETIVPGTIYESSIGDSSGSFTSNSPFALFTVNTGNAIDNRKGICCIYYIKIYDENNNLIHDLQPFKYDNNKGCIRDMVTGKVYYSNSGNITAR